MVEEPQALDVVSLDPQLSVGWLEANTLRAKCSFQNPDLVSQSKVLECQLALSLEVRKKGSVEA
jgi:hypothetical protein